MTQPGAQLSGMFHIGITVLHHHAVGPHIAEILPAPAPSQKCLDEAWIPPSPPRWPVEVHIVAYPGAQLSEMVHMGNTVLHHHAVGPHVAEIPPTPHPKKLLGRGLL